MSQSVGVKVKVMPLEQILNIEQFQVGHPYSRKDVADAGEVPRPKQDRDWSGIVTFKNCILLFVTLDKTGFDESNQYHDFFDENGTMFYWDSQSRNTQKTPAIARIINGDEVIVFVRIAAKIKNQTQPFIYVGKLIPLDYDGEKPVQLVFEVSEHVGAAPVPLRAIYNWEPSGKRKLRSIEVDDAKTSDPQKKKKLPKGGQGRLIDPAKKKAIELHAMAVAREHYESLDYQVTDTSKKDASNKAPFDLLCLKDAEIRKIEVKGTTQSPLSVNVTANEVESARGLDCETDLFIVYGITVYKELGEYRAEGGDTKILTNWIPEDEQLTPTQFVYRLSE